MGMLPVGGRFRRWVAGFLLIADRQLDVRTFAVVPGKLYITFIFGTGKVKRDLPVSEGNQTPPPDRPAKRV